MHTHYAFGVGAQEMCVCFITAAPAT